MPKVSVIIPVYNTEKYLARCIDSVVSQSFDDIEIICINDASTDNSLEVLKMYAKFDNRINIMVVCLLQETLAVLLQRVNI